MFLCLADWPASARLVYTGVMPRLYREGCGGGGGGRGAGEEGEGGREWGVGGEMGGGRGAGGVYFLWEDRWRRVLNFPTVPAETTLLSRLFHSRIVLGKKLFLKTGVEACWM